MMFNATVFMGVCVFVSCSAPRDELGQTDAYNAKQGEVHVVVAAPPTSEKGQRLWVCRGSSILHGTNARGYRISIGKGAGKYTAADNQTLKDRNISGSNLTPLGEMRIRVKVGHSCGAGMLARCMKLSGIEDGVNENAQNRGIYIHGTNPRSYSKLGTSASLGCIRMTESDVAVVYDQVNVGTKVFVNSKVVDNNDPCAFTGVGENGKAR